MMRSGLSSHSALSASHTHTHTRSLLTIQHNTRRTWHALSICVREATVSNYNIFLHGTTLFAYMEFVDEAAVDSLKVRCTHSHTHTHN